MLEVEVEVEGCAKMGCMPLPHSKYSAFTGQQFPVLLGLALPQIADNVFVAQPTS